MREFMTRMLKFRTVLLVLGLRCLACLSSAIPSDVTLLCNNIPCDETVIVNDIITCVAHGYPHPAFDLRIQDMSADKGDKSDCNGVGSANRFFMDTDEDGRDDGSGDHYTNDTIELEIKVSEGLRIGPRNAEHVEITCNASNTLGWRCNSMIVEVKLEHGEDDATDTALSSVEDAATYGDPVSIDLMCDGSSCKPDGYVYVGDQLLFQVYATDIKKWGRFDCELWINGVGMSRHMHRCQYTWKINDLGYKNVETKFSFPGEFAKSLNISLYVISNHYDDYQILCNGRPCIANEIMKVGDKISVYIDETSKNTFQYNINLPGFTTWTTWFYVLKMKDLGEKRITLRTWNSWGRNINLTSQIIVLSDPPHGVDMICNGKFCENNGIMRVGDEISCSFQPVGVIYKMTFRLQIDGYTVAEGYPCMHVLREEDVGTKSIKCLARDSEQNYWKQGSFNVACAFRDDVVWKHPPFSMDMMCNGKFCPDNETMRFGDEISCNFEPKSLLDRLTMTLLIDGHAIVEGYPCMHVLREEDVGTKLIECHANGTKCGPYQTTRTISVACDVRDDLAWKPAKKHPPFSIDMMCNGKFCQDNETMRFGDEISCNFEPKSMLDRLTFSLLIDGYAIVEGYPCMHVLREEDVGTKLIECHAKGTKCGPYKKTQNISVVCAFRDDVIWKPVKRGFDTKDFEVIFNRNNATHPAELIILCGDEPCDKPGRIIYVGTYVTCRLRDGKMNNLKMKVNDKLISGELPVTLSEIVYKLEYNDIGTISATCFGHSFDVNFVNETTVNFTVRHWPCLDAKPASADIMLEHGDAAGAIDGGLTEKIDEEPAAGNKDGPKWNDDEEAAAGNKDGPKKNDGIPAEKSAKDDESKPNSGNGQGRFVLLQLFLAFIAAYVGLGQF